MYSNDLVFLSINNGSSLNAYLFSSNDVYNTTHCCPFFEDFFVNHSLNKLKDESMKCLATHTFVVRFAYYKGALFFLLLLINDESSSFNQFQ